MDLSEFYRESNLVTTLKKLTDYDWLETNDKAYFVRVPVYKEWVVKNHKLSHLVNLLFDSQRKAFSLFLQARETRICLSL